MPIAAGTRAQDVALRFRAHLVPPPPPPITDSAALTPAPATPAPPAPLRSRLIAPGQGALSSGERGGPLPAPTPGVVPPLSHTGKPRSCATLASGWMRCVWSLSDIPTERERFAAEPNTWLVAAQSTPLTQSLDTREDDSAITPVPGMASPPSYTSTSPVGATQWLGMGGPVRHTLVQATTPTPAPIENTIAIVATLPARLMLHAPDQPEHLGPLLTFTSQAAEQVQVTVRYDDPAMPGPNDQDTLTVNLPAGTLANYAALHIGVTVPPDTAPGVQVCLSVAWRGLTSGAGGATRACTVTADAPASSPTAPPVPSGPGGSGVLDCAPLPLVRLSGVTAPDPRLVAPAVASFAAVRAEIQERTGVDALAVLADVLRQPSFTTSKSGVLQTSWHKAGRAIDLNQGGPFVRVAEGQQFRLYVGNVDVTAIFETHGWQRIPVQGDTAEWWHYEWHSDGIAWTSAMLQIWDLPTLTAAFPEVAWGTIGCAAGSNTGPGDSSTQPQETDELCVLGAPRYRSAVETFPGCGPPVRAGDNVAQLDTTLGFVGLSGRTSGPHLHLGLKVRSYDGSWPLIDICTPEWRGGRAPPADANCFADMADPLAFLPQAPGNTSAGSEGVPAPRQLGAADSRPGAANATPIIPEGAPYQLPPPNYPNALVFTPISGATPVGQYWSPYADGGQYGGGSVGDWFCSLWSGWPWCK